MPTSERITVEKDPFDPDRVKITYIRDDVTMGSKGKTIQGSTSHSLRLPKDLIPKLTCKLMELYIEENKKHEHEVPELAL